MNVTSPHYSLQSIVPQAPASLESADPKTANAMTDFLHLMVAQLQNQNPDNPMDGTQLVSQMEQLNASIATERMSYLSSANDQIATAAALLGRSVNLKDPTTGAQISGKVGSVDYSGDSPKILVNGTSYPLSAVNNVSAS